MKRILLLLFIPFLFSFTSNLNFGVNECIQLNDNEKEIKITQDLIDDYESIIDFLPVQTPINKIFASGEKLTYIGILLESQKNMFIDQIRKNQECEIIDKRNLRSNKLIKLLLKKNDSYANVLVVETSSMTFIFVRLFDDYNTSSNDFDNLEMLNERIGC